MLFGCVTLDVQCPLQTAFNASHNHFFGSTALGKSLSTDQRRNDGDGDLLPLLLPLLFLLSPFLEASRFFIFLRAVVIKSFMLGKFFMVIFFK